MDLPPPVEGGNLEMKVLLVVVKKVQVEDLCSMLVRIGLQPVAVGVDSFALGNAFELNESLSPGIHDAGRTVALVDVGANKSCINILRNGVSSFTREVYIGGNDFTNALMRRLGADIHQAEQIKCDPQEKAPEVQSAIVPILDDLGNEINLSFDYFENQYDSEVTEVYLSGGSSLLPFLEESFERIFEKKTRVWNPIEGLKVKSDNVDIDSLNRFAPQLAVGVGLAATVA
jgi:type IV pilus assembly protein PilM